MATKRSNEISISSNPSTSVFSPRNNLRNDFKECLETPLCFGDRDLVLLCDAVCFAPVGESVDVGFDSNTEFLSSRRIEVGSVRVEDGGELVEEVSSAVEDVLKISVTSQPSNNAE